MGFKITDATWLTTEADRIEALMLMPKYWGVEWTGANLIIALADIGLTYSNEQLLLIKDELLSRGVIEEV